MVKDILYLLYFLLALLYQMHIIEQSFVYIVRLGATDDNYFSMGRLPCLPFAQGWRLVKMTDGNRTKFNVSEYHHERIRDNSYGFIFSAWVQICQIFDATLCSGSIDFVFVDCASIFVSGARPCSHDIAKYV